MKGRVTVILAVVTAIAVMAAAAVLMRDHRAQEPQARLALYPKIDSQYDAIARIAIADRQGHVLLARTSSGGWVLPERADYPADAAKVRRLLLAFPQLTVIEAKTRRPDLYARLGVTDLDAAGSRALRVTLATDSGKTVATLLVGDRVQGQTPGQAPNMNGTAERVYVRKAGEPQSWLVDGLPELAAAPAAWLDDRLLSVARERVQAVIVRHKDGEVLRFSRAAETEPDFHIADMPRGRVVRPESGPLVVAAALSFLAFDDVRPAQKTGGAADAVATFTTFDGLEITAALHGEWAHFDARGTRAAATAEARAISGRLKSWDYKLPAYKVKELAPQLDDMLEPRAAPH